MGSVGLDLRKDFALVSRFVWFCCVRCERAAFSEMAEREQSREVLIPALAVGAEK